jgi:type I pantothenate kinase
VEREGYAPVVELIAARLPAPRPVVVGIAGGVAVGKSTMAAAVADGLAGRSTVVVATDGFLLPNAELERRGLGARKGFPESYDDEGIRSFLRGVRDGHPDVTAPIYSHERYEVVADRRQPVAGTDVVVLEGVNALRFAGLLDVRVYLDAAEAAMEEWYVARFRRWCVDPPPGTFYAGFAGLEPETVGSIAREVWRAVNLVNLRTHIAPTRAAADVVVEKAADHRVARVLVPEARR